MAVSIQTLNQGDTGYIAKHNSNYQNIKVIVDSLESQVGSILNTGGNTTAMLDALFGAQTAVIGKSSYSLSGSGATLTINAGFAYLRSASGVVQIPANTNSDFTGLASGTYYIHAGADGQPVRDQAVTEALYSVVWDGSNFGAITRIAPIAWGFTTWSDAQNSAILGVFDGLDDRLGAIESAAAPVYDVTGTFNNAPGVNDVIVRYPFTRQVQFLTNLPNAQCVAGIAATAQTVLDIRRNDVSIGSITFTASAAVATFSFASDITFSISDVLTVVAPGTPDLTLADIGLSIAGQRL